MGFSGGTSGKEPTVVIEIRDTGSIPGQEDPLEESMATHSSILAWRIHEQRSLVGYSPWGLKESDSTEVT